VAPALDRLGALLAARPDVVFFMYGANDVAKHEPLAEFAAALGTALSGLSSMRVIVLSPQPNQLTRAVRAPYDEVLRNAAASRHLTYIDSLQAFPPEELVSLSADGLHLNDLGHARLASYLAAELSTLELTAAPPAPASPDAPTPSHPGR
jgi:lysophospholipase L1-like esterase